MTYVSIRKNALFGIVIYEKKTRMGFQTFVKRPVTTSISNILNSSPPRRVPSDYIHNLTRTLLRHCYKSCIFPENRSIYCIPADSSKDSLKSQTQHNNDLLHKGHRSDVQTVFDQKLNRKQYYYLLLKRFCIVLSFIITLTYMPTSFYLEQVAQFVRTVICVMILRMSKTT